MYRIKVVTEHYIDPLRPSITESAVVCSCEDFYEARNKASKVGFNIYCKMDDRADTKCCIIRWDENPEWDVHTRRKDMRIGVIRWFNASRRARICVYITRD